MRLLQEVGVDKQNIILSTQIEDDYTAMQQDYGDSATVIFGAATSVAENRNTLLDYCCANGIRRVMFLDDDVSALLVYSDGKFRKLTANEFLPTVRLCFRIAQDAGATIFGFFYCDNALFSRGRKPTLNEFIVAAAMGILDTRVRFDTAFRIKEDYELACRLIHEGCRTLRFNNLAMRYGFMQNGGCRTEYDRGGREAASIQLVNKYPQLVDLRPDGEVKLINKNKQRKK